MMVPRVNIHLSAPGIKPLTLSQFGLKAVILICLTLTGCFWWIGTNLNHQIDAFVEKTQMIMAQTRQVVIETKSEGIDLSDQAIQKIPKHISFIKQVRERVGFSWTQLLTDLESAVPKNLIMSGVSLDEKTHIVRLSGSTPSLKNLNQFIHQLEKHSAFQDVILTQHAKKKKGKIARQSHIVFSMKVAYNPDLHLSKTIQSKQS